MSDNFQIGSSLATEDCWLKFHQFSIFDTTKFTTSGPIYWDNTEKCFYVFTPPSQTTEIPNEIITDNTSKSLIANLGKKTFRNK